MTTTSKRLLCALGLLAAPAACGGKARGTDAYRADTQKLLDTREATLKGCYDEALKSDAKLTGTVKVTFVVQKKTGAFVNPQLDPATSAPEPLGRCVLQALDGLKLEPPDRKEGRASFEYSFNPSTS
jgi:hypothetical protein